MVSGGSCLGKVCNVGIKRSLYLYSLKFHKNQHLQSNTLYDYLYFPLFDKKGILLIQISIFLKILMCYFRVYRIFLSFCISHFIPFLVFTEKFCDEFVGEAEHFGKWSSGSNNDER